MAKKTETKSRKKAEIAEAVRDPEICADKSCPAHGTLSLRGRTFEGRVIKKFPKRITIAFERNAYVRKYERYIKNTTKMHARLPECMDKEINVGDHIQIMECRPLSKLIHFVVVKKIRDGDGNLKENKKRKGRK